ncbi:hypothetical protein ACFY36_26725 [Actinoplanes sp. NPDC000266]
MEVLLPERLAIPDLNGRSWSYIASLGLYGDTAFKIGVGESEGVSAVLAAVAALEWAGAWHDAQVVDIYELLPHERTPVDYRDLVNDPRIDQEGLRQLGRNPFSFVRSAVARSPRADATTLAAVSLDGLDRWTRNSVLLAIARHHNADRSTLLGTLREVRALLNQPGERPFAAALALARRAELSETEVLGLIDQPNASRRMARGVRRALAEREPR